MCAGMPSAGAPARPWAWHRYPVKSGDAPRAPGCPAEFPGSKWSGSCPTFLGWEWRRQVPASDDKVTPSCSRPAHRAPLLRCCWAVTKSCHQGPVIGDCGGRAGAEGATRLVAGRPVGLAVATLSCVPWPWPSSSPRGRGASQAVQGVIVGSGHCPAGTRSASVSTLPSKARSLGWRDQGDS